MAVTRLHIINMLVLFIAGLFILGLSLVTANSLSTMGSGVPFKAWKFYVGREILPDNVLYPFMMIRDRIRLDDVSPEEQVDLKLQYAEKRYGTVQELVNHQEISLAISTMTRYQKYVLSAGDQALSFESAPKEQVMRIKQAAESSLARTDEFVTNHPEYEMNAIAQLRDDTKVLLGKIDERLSKI